MVRLETYLEFIGFGDVMPYREKNKRIAAYGDFQTPIELARQVCDLLSQRGLQPASVLEPSCGEGSFLLAALEMFPSLRSVVGIEINEAHVNGARAVLSDPPGAIDIRVIHEDFFTVNWGQVLASLPDPLVVIGNPPWVTNAELGRLGGFNLPAKSNFQKRRGIDAITGKSNFDISEWLLIQVLQWLTGRRATLGMLCKTAVARKVLLHAWRNGQTFERSDIYRFEAARYFGASVDACLLVVTTCPGARSHDCYVYDNFNEPSPTRVLGYREDHLVDDVVTFDRWKHLEAKVPRKWRSGIKHDCSKVMELREENAQFRNGMGEIVDLENEYLYPLLKTSDLTNGPRVRSSHWMLVTQRYVGEDTSHIRNRAPRTWKYLNTHAHLLDGRRSAIYRNRPRFSVFGVGEYTFTPWKVAVSGLRKKLGFMAVGPHQEKPVVFDDTCYFLPCTTEQEAHYLARLLNSHMAKEFLGTSIFWDAKRPVTGDILGRLDLVALGRELSLGEQAAT